MLKSEVITEEIMMTDEKWKAIIRNDASCDGQFFYAVKTTGIFCRPSCKSRPPKKENVGLFRTANQALHLISVHASDASLPASGYRMMNGLL